MADLIYRSGVAQVIEIAQRSLLTDNDAMWENNRKYYKGLAWSRRIIDEAPAVDAVEVVRCGKCKHNPGYKAKAKNMVWCRQWRAYVSNTGFCSYGERWKDDGTTQI